MEQLSLKAREFIKNNPLKREIKSINLCKRNSYYDPNTNEIFLNEKLVMTGEYDFMYLHEYCHAIQFENKFAHIVVCGGFLPNVEKELCEVASVLNSCILDLNVNKILKNYDFFYSTQELFFSIKDLKRFINEYINKRTFQDCLNNTTYIMGKIINLYFDVSKEEAQKCISILEGANIIFLVNEINKLIAIIQQVGIGTIEGCTIVLREINNYINFLCGTKYFDLWEKM